MVWHELQKLYEREVLLTESDPYLTILKGKYTHQLRCPPGRKNPPIIRLQFSMLASVD